MYEMNKEEDPVKEDDPVIINNEKEEMEDLHHNPEDILFQQVSPRDCRVAWKDEKPYIWCRRKITSV